MPKFKVESTTELDAEESFKRVKKFLSEDQDLRRLNTGFQCSFEDAEKKAKASGSQFTAHLSVTSHSPTKIIVDVEIPLLLTPFKGKITEVLQKKLAKILT